MCMLSLLDSFILNTVYLKILIKLLNLFKDNQKLYFKNDLISIKLNNLYNLDFLNNQYFLYQ